MGSHTISMMLLPTVSTLLTVLTYVTSVPLSGPVYGKHFEGDIAIRDPEKFAKTGILRAFVKNKELRWSRTIQYSIGSDLDDYRTTIQECLQWIQDHSCLVFIEGTTGDHIKFTSFGDNENSGQGCWSYFGRRGGEQVVNLEIPSCLTKDTIYHEIFHALGKVHEQSRPDRDDYVEILLENVQGGEEHQFEIKKNVDTANTHYDLASIMHYGPHAFSYNGGQLLSQSTERVSVTHKNLQQPIFGNSTMRMDASHRLTSPRRRRHPRRSHRRLKHPRRPLRLGSRYTTT